MERLDVHALLLLHFVNQAHVEQRMLGGSLEIPSDHLVPARAIRLLQTQHVGKAEAANGLG